MTLLIGDIPVDPAVILAPMAGITDAPMRKIVAQFGAGLVVSEMVASQEMVQDKRAMREKAIICDGPVPTSVQIAGRISHWMQRAAEIATDQGADLIDINMGCPAKKVTTGYSGSALMRDPDHALTLIEAVVAGTDRPVTLKMRLGWDRDCLNAPDIARRAQDAGVQMITIHGRTRNQFYKGQADWQAIAAVVQAVHIPVIANGDIVDSPSARAALAASGAAGVMVGRGAQGAPWVIAQLAHDLHGTPAPDIPTGAALARLVSNHYDAMLSFYGADLGLRVARKHLGWYMDRTGAPPDLRKQMLTAKTPADVFSLIPDAMAPHDTTVAA
ncbi:MAG: tRNA dihydrouridine synthase DusB [Pseudomonadota bacterium]